jgi:hypothetical protein
MQFLAGRHMTPNVTRPEPRERTQPALAVSMRGR